MPEDWKQGPPARSPACEGETGTGEKRRRRQRPGRQGHGKEFGFFFFPKCNGRASRDLCVKRSLWLLGLRVDCERGQGEAEKRRGRTKKEAGSQRESIFSSPGERRHLGSRTDRSQWRTEAICGKGCLGLSLEYTQPPRILADAGIPVVPCS